MTKMMKRKIDVKIYDQIRLYHLGETNITRNHATNVSVCATNIAKNFTTKT